MRQYLLLTSVLLLAACSGSDVKDTLGLKRQSPDEFRVVTRPPLSVPPQFDLRPPAPVGEGRSGVATDEQAKSLMLGTVSESGNTFRLKPDNSPLMATLSPSSGKLSPETNFLTRAGATEANPEIRRVIEAEKRAAVETVEEDSSWWNVLSLTDKKDPMVDAQGEAERIKSAQAEGQPITGGKTPEAKQRDTGVLGGIFGY